MEGNQMHEKNLRASREPYFPIKPLLPKLALFFIFYICVLRYAVTIVKPQTDKKGLIIP
jgi:hypothetical protein